MSENEGGLDKAKNKIKAAGQGRGKGASPQWNESSKHVQTRWLLYGLIGAVVGVWVIVLNWLFTAANIANLPAKALEAGVDLTVVMAPVIAGAAGVERLLETVFNTLEGAWRTLIAYLGYGMRWLKSTETEVAEARNWLQNMGAIYNGSVAANNQQLTIMFNEHKTKLVAELKAAAALAADPRLKTFLEGTAEQTTQLPAEMLARMTDLLITPPDLPLPVELVTKVNDLRLSVLNQVEALNKQATATLTWTEAMLKDAEKRLQAAEDKLAGATSSEDYKSAKSAASIILGLMFGVVVAALGQIQMFALLGIDQVPPQWDVLVTGLIIGTGSNPVHSLIGILQQGKNALDSLSGFLDTRSKPAKTDS